MNTEKENGRARWQLDRPTKEATTAAACLDSNLISLEIRRRRRDERRAREWREARGLLSIRDKVEDYRRTHWCRPGLVAALPTDVLGEEVRR